jgi:hypothetical protein
MGYIVLEYLAYLAVVAALGALLFSASATVLLVTAGAKGATQYARSSARKARLLIGGSIALARAPSCTVVPSEAIEAIPAPPR